jgi:hypothetical protein
VSDLSLLNLVLNNGGSECKATNEYCGLIRVLEGRDDTITKQAARIAELLEVQQELVNQSNNAWFECEEVKEQLEKANKRIKELEGGGLSIAEIRDHNSCEWIDGDEWMVEGKFSPLELRAIALGFEKND